MVENWNATVKKGDVVYVVGDFAHKADATRLKEIYGRLTGDKHLLEGNHDGRDVLALGWSSVEKWRWVRDSGQRVFLCHYAFREWPNFFGNTVHLYGHSHANLPGNARSDDCGVDAQARYRAMAEGRDVVQADYRPYSLEEIMVHMVGRPRYEPHVKVF